MSDPALDQLTREQLLEILGTLGLTPRHLAAQAYAVPEQAESTALSARDRDALRADHPALVALRSAYDQHPATIDPPQWTAETVRSGLDLQRFRDDNVYVWQQRALALEIRYLVAAQYVRAHDDLGLRHRVAEDGAFGAHTVDVDGWTVSRDLLDSILQLAFLARTIGLDRWPNVTWLDIGAGYGRLAHRAVLGLPNVDRFLCTDAIAESTYLCEYYLRYRGIQHRATSVPLHEIESALGGLEVHLASNTQSFSECSLKSIEWWLDLVARHHVRYLFIEPNERDAGEQLTCLPRKAGHWYTTYHRAIEARGYRRIAAEPKYAASPMTQRYGLYPGHFHLFERT